MNKLAISNKNLRPILHIAAWAIIVIIPGYLIKTYGDGDTKTIVRFFGNTLIAGIIFYLNYLWLVPRLYLKDKKASYFLSAALLISVLYIASWYLNDQMFHEPEKQQQIEKLMKELSKEGHAPKPPIKQFHVYYYMYTSILIIGFSLGLGVMDKLAQNEKQRKELEKEKLNSELAFLKNQISPHFFFNTLNNIYSLIGMDTEAAQESVLKLSKLMRYLLYESEHGKTPVSNEIEFIKNYIDLMKLRISPKVDLQFHFPEVYPNYNIPPLLFISFIENAFKHGISYREHSFIHIGMNVDEEKIDFNISNSIGASSAKNDQQASGIGLENVRKRLALLFPDTHTLSINQDDKSFSVALTVHTKHQEK